MARCPYCDHILKDEWLRATGARLMGQKGGQVKRNKTSGKGAATARWNKKKHLKKQPEGG